MPDEIVELPPLLPLEWESSWAGEITLPSWAGFHYRRSGYGPASVKKPPAGTVEITVESPDRKRPQPPSPEQVAAIRHLVENEAEVAQTLAQAFLNRYPAERADYLDAYDIEESEDVPEISDVTGLHPLLGLHSVRVLDVFREGLAYVGFEFRCVWETEHGAGAMTHKGRVISIGRATAAIDFWAAKRDSEREGTVTGSA